MELRTDPQALLRNATRLAERGWPVFLLGRTKRPVANCPGCPKGAPGHDPEACTCLTCHGFYAATVDPQRIQAMCAQHPGGLLAIRTGAASDTVVVDIDPRHGGCILPDLMPRTACVDTSRGWHLYYRHPGTPIVSRELPGHPGVDIKADSGYVVAPPSIHPITGLAYRWVGTHPVIEIAPPLLAVCQAAPAPTASATTRPTTTPGGGAISSPDALLAANLNAVRRAPKGRRRVTLYGSARGVARMVAADALTRADAWAALTAAGKAAGQSDRDIRAAITSGFNAEGVAA
jgi:hypothetical protein